MAGKQIEFRNDGWPETSTTRAMENDVVDGRKNPVDQALARWSVTQQPIQLVDYSLSGSVARS